MRQNQQNKQRMRGRPNRKAPNPLTRSFDSNGPDIKIRGTALHIAEKYTQLARDASSAGDRVMAENYLQHAEHYYRIIAAAQAAQAAAAQGREDDSEDDDFEPIGSDRFEPRQIEIRQPGQFDNNNRQPNEQREPREQREGGYQNRDGQQRDYNRNGDNNRGGDNRNNGDNNRNGDNGDRQQQDRNEYRRDRRQRFDRFGRDNRGDRQGQNQDNRGGERQPQPTMVPTLADAPQPDVSFPDTPQPVVRAEREPRPAPAAAEAGLPAFLLDRQPRVSEPAPVAVAERPAPAAERPAPAAERPAAEPARVPAPEPVAAAPTEAGADEETPRKRVPRRRATTIGTPIAATTRPRTRRAKAATEGGSEGGEG